MKQTGDIQMILYIDGHCRYCRAAAQTIQRLDLFHQIQVRSYREDQSYRAYGITPEEADGAMQAILLGQDGHQVVSGFDAVEAVTRTLPPLWPLLPLLCSLRLMGLGDRAYRFLAENRILVPDARSCRLGDATCSLEGRSVMAKGDRTPLPWLRYLAFLTLLMIRSGNDPRFSVFGLFGFFVLWGHPNRFLRGISYLGFLGLLSILVFL